jgi:predicted ATPase
MSKIYLESIKLKGIHKRYNLDVKFNETLNVLHGQNGTGKSTLIHIIANIANCDFIRFAYLEFEKISVIYSNGASIILTQTQTDGNEDRRVNILTDQGANYSFSKREAFDAVRNIEEDNTYKGYKPELIEHLEDFVTENSLRYLDTSYFPAFRTMLEAWSSHRDMRSGRLSKRVNSSIQQATSFSRNLFSQFLPTINFPSPLDIEDNLRREIRDAQINIARYESSIFSDSFVKVFNALLNTPTYEIKTDELLSEISDLTSYSNNSKLGDFESNSNTYRQLQALVESSNLKDNSAASAAGALVVYRDALKERQSFQLDVFKEIDKYFEVVNSFLDKKELTYEVAKDRRIPRVGLKFPDDTWSSIKVMSSGERQLLTMLYAVNKMSGNSAVLIDEPELSLHIDWQEDLLSKMMEQLGDRQIIVCTHSPAIAADFEEYMQEIVPVFKDIVQTEIDFSDFDGEDFF